MNGLTHSQAQRRYDNSCDCCGPSHDDDLARIQSAILADPQRLADIDLVESMDLGDTLTEMFSVLADDAQCGALDRICDGVPADQFNALQAETFRRLLRLRDRIAKVRADAVAAAAGDELERQLGRAA